MSSLGIALISLIGALGGAWAGILIRKRLPESHRSNETSEVIKLSTGLVGTMAALVLGLLVASAATEFNAESSGLQTLATDCLVLDRALGHYGPEAAGAREQLHGIVGGMIRKAESKGQTLLVNTKAPRMTTAAAALFDTIRDLNPRTESQKTIQNLCMQISVGLAKTRWAVIQGADNPIPPVFLVVLVFWLTALFLGFGLLSPPNRTVYAVLFVSAVSVSAAMFIMLDLNEPFDGLIQVSIDPIRDAFKEMTD